MLESFPGFETSDPELTRQIMLSEYGGRQAEYRLDSAKFHVKANWAETRYLRVTKGFCTPSVDVRYDPTTSVRQYFAYGKSTYMEFHTTGHEQQLSHSSRGSVIVPAGSPVRIKTSGSSEFIALRFEMEDIRKTLSSLLGDEVASDIQFTRYLDEKDGRLQSIRNAVLDFIHDLDTVDQQLRALTDTFGQALLVRFLMRSSHNFSNKLRVPPLATSAAQMRQIENYIEANWQREIQIDELVKISGIGARSIFRHFRKVRGVTPQEFVRTIRLHNARNLLQKSGGSAGVTETAFKCGFLSLGHFASQYQKTFGELPSETVKRRRVEDLAQPRRDYSMD